MPSANKIIDYVKCPAAAFSHSVTLISSLLIIIMSGSMLLDVTVTLCYRNKQKSQCNK